MTISRRTLLAGTAGLALSQVTGVRPALAAGSRVGGAAGSGPAAAGQGAAAVRAPGSLPHPGLPAGTVDVTLPFDHVVVVMMENHSFDNYFGMLPRRGQPLADGFTFDATGLPTNRNPIDPADPSKGYQRVFHLDGTCQPNGVSQAWDATHEQVNLGKIDGYAATDHEAMGYWDETDIPFYYSLAKTFTLGNRAFCATPGQTYPNRRYLISGTSSGLTSTSSSTFTMAAVPGGTIADAMSNHGVTWKSYFSDLPAFAIVPQTLETYPQNFATIAEFLADAAAGTLPQVSYVDPEFGAIDDVGGNLTGYLSQAGAIPGLSASAQQLVNASNLANSQGGDEENPQDISIGENFVSQIVNAVLASPLWARTLLVWTYDEHGGYYDHVAPPTVIAPDDVAPDADKAYAGFTVTGPRVPTVVVSPYSRPGGVSNVAHDHTATIATIAAKWNLPALTYRDANSPTLLDYLDLVNPPALLVPPTLAAPSTPAAASNSCRTEGQPVVVEGASAGTATVTGTTGSAGSPGAGAASSAGAAGSPGLASGTASTSSSAATPELAHTGLGTRPLVAGGALLAAGVAVRRSLRDGDEPAVDVPA